MSADDMLLGETEPVRWLDRLRDTDIMRTNQMASRHYAVGSTVEIGGERYKVTRHKVYETIPEATYVIYGVKV